MASAAFVVLTAVVAIEAGVLSAIALFGAGTLILMVALSIMVGNGGAPESRPLAGPRRAGLAAWLLSRRFTRVP